jgi:polyhydroxybutyrate depolymerase
MKRIVLAGATVLVLLAAAATYFLYAPAPTWPTEGLLRHTVEVQDRQRSYSVFVPPNAAPGARVLLALHPSLGRGDMMRSQVGGSLERLALRDGAIVVYPDGLEGHFNDCRRAATYSARTLRVDDIGFLRRIVERLVAEHGADPKRVDALGYSNGGHMALRLALEAPDLVRGVVAIAANMPASNNLDCAVHAAPVSRIVMIQGTKDPVNPYTGGDVSLFGMGSRGEVLSAQASADWWVQRLGLAPAEDRVVGESGSVRARQQDWTAATGQVRLVSLDGGGHAIPQADYRYPRLMGGTYLKDDLLAAAWHMLDQR